MATAAATGGRSNGEELPDGGSSLFSGKSFRQELNAHPLEA
jgi:hypothetical protein